MDMAGIRRLVNLKEAAEMLNVTVSTLRGLCLQGRICSVRIARLIMVPCEEIDRLVKEGTLSIIPRKPARSISQPRSRIDVGVMVLADILGAEFIEKLFRELSERECQVIMRRASESLRQIGETMAVTRERIRQIECMATRKMRRLFWLEVRKQLLMMPVEEIGKNLSVPTPPISLPPEDAARLLIDDMEISCRLYNFLKVANIMTLGEMAACTDYDLLRMKNFGRRTLDEAKTLLASYGLFLRARR